MTETEIRQTIRRMKMDDRCKAALLKQALGGNASAQFVVFAAKRKQDKEG